MEADRTQLFHPTPTRMRREVILGRGLWSGTCPRVTTTFQQRTGEWDWADVVVWQFAT